MCQKIKNKKCISEVPPVTLSFNVYNIAKYKRFALKAVCVLLTTALGRYVIDIET